ncbi:MAG: EF-hand domain-containing protein [Pseudomonadota bacterium]
MIGGISSSSAFTQMASTLFSKLDSKNQGYVEQSDLESAFSTLGSSGASAEQVFSTLDGDGDGKVTETEFSDSLQSLLDELQGQMQASRGGAMSGMPPPPPPPSEGDAGLTQEELSTLAEEIAGTDSAMSSLMASIAADFDTADADGDGKVNRAEAMAYQSANGQSESEGTTDSASGTAGNGDVLRQILALLKTYGQMDGGDTSSLVTQA